MSVWFMDSFDHYNNDNWGLPSVLYGGREVLRKWTNLISTNIPEFETVLRIAPAYARQTPGQGLRLQGPTSGSNAILYKNHPAGSVTTGIIGVAILFTAFPGTSTSFLGFIDNETEQCGVRGNGAGKLTFTRGTNVLATSTNSISLNTWYYIEVRATISSTVGQYEVRVNNTSVNWIPQSTANKDTAATVNDYTTGFYLGAFSNASPIYFDDVYFADTLGGVHDDFLGPQMVVCLRPVAPGSNADFTPNFGVNHANVGKIYPDSCTTFNQSATAGHIDSFVMQKIPISAGTVVAVQHVIQARKDAGAARTLSALTYSGGTPYPGTAKALTTGDQYLLETQDVSPVDNGAWSIAKVDGYEQGYKLVT